MSASIPEAPAGNGAHPILMVVISANMLQASSAFYAKLFGWQMMPMSAELTAAGARGGPSIALRANVPAGFPSSVPFIKVADVAVALDRVVAGGATVERAPWTIPMVGTLARFKDASGTIYGLTSGMTEGEVARVPMPFGDNPKPLPGTICSLEMYAADGAAAGRFFGEQFGWGAMATMPPYVAFDPGAGIGGVFQGHSPAAPAMTYIYVEDVAATLTAIDAAGGARSGEPMRAPGMGCFGYFTDPSGSSMGLIGP